MPTAPPPSKDVAIEARVFWLRFKKEIAAAVIIVLLGIIGFAGYRFYSARRDATAAEFLAQAKTANDYQQVIANYAGTPAGADAHLFLADLQRAEKKLPEANATLQGFLNKYPEHELVTTARMAMAANLDSMGKTDEALTSYRQIASAYPKSFNAPLALISCVHLLKAKGQNEEALQICDKIRNEYADSMTAREAAQESFTLRKKVPAKEPPALGASPTGAQPAPPLLARPPAAASPSTAVSPGKKP